MSRKFIFGGSYSGAFVYDVDAQNYFNANSAITLDADKLAINSFYLALKADGIYTKLKAMYLPIWGSATTSKWNLVNPVDTNAAFRLTPVGGWSYLSNGIQGNAVNTRMGTNFFAAVHSLTNGSIGIYNQTNNSGAYYDFSNLSGSFEQTIVIKFSDNKLYFNSGSQTYPNALNSDARGFYALNYNSTNVKGYKNGSLLVNESKSSTANNNEYLIGANSVGNVSNRTYSFAYIADGLTDTNVLNLYTRVQTLMTHFGINV